MIRSELLNLRSTMTARLLLLGSMAMAAISLLANLATFDTAELSQTANIEQAMHSSTVATLTFAFVAGLVTSTADYRFGRMDQLLLSSPKTSVVLVSKAAVGFCLGVLYGVLGSIVALGVLATYYSANDVTIDLTSTTVMLPLAGVIAGAGLFAVAGIGMGTAIRNQPLAIGGGLALLLVVQPPLLLGFPDLGRWFPGAAGLAMTLAPDPAMLGQATGGLVMVIWALFALAAGAHRLETTGS